MNKADLQEMKEDRLANFAVAAFLGSLLMGQAWEMWEGSEGTTELLMFTVPDYWGLVILTFMVRLFRLVAVSSYGVDGNTTPALGTCCNPFGCTYHVSHRVDFLHLRLVVFNFGTPR